MYTVTIRENSTMEVEKIVMQEDWQEGSDYWWSEGNFGCDCNRRILFYRAKGVPYEDIETQCGDTGYSVLSIVLPDGRDMAPSIEGLNGL